MVHFDTRIKPKLAETALLHHLKGLFMLITMVQIPASYLIQMHGYVHHVFLYDNGYME